MASMSITKGKGNMKHNERKQSKKPRNVDFSRTHLNLVLENKDIKNVYHELFDKSIDEYNLNQKRNDRKIKDYYTKIVHDKKTKPFHELVIQIGNIDNNIDISVSNQIYTDFVEQFKINNPQMKVIGAYVHNDEATAHLHLDYIPFAYYSRGQKIRVSNDKAIEQMNYGSWTKWQEKQYEILENIAINYSIGRTVMNNHEKHRTIDGYKREQRIIDQNLQNLEKSLETSQITPKKTILGKETIDYDIFRQYEKQNKLQKAQISILSDENKKLEVKYKDLKNKSYVQDNEVLKEIINEKETYISHLERTSKQNERYKEKYKELQIEHEKAKREIGKAHKFIIDLGLKDIYNSYRQTFNKHTAKDILEISKKAVEKIKETIERIETLYYRPISIKEQLNRAKEHKQKEVITVIDDYGKESKIEINDHDTAKKIFEIIATDKEERLGLLKTPENIKLHDEIMRDKERKLERDEYEIEL